MGKIGGRDERSLRRSDEGSRGKGAAAMGKRKRVTKSLEESDRKMYKTFSSAANAVSLLYTQAQSQQKRAYFAGAQDAFEKVLKWVDSKNIPSNGVQRQALTDFIHHELDAVESET